MTNTDVAENDKRWDDWSESEKNTVILWCECVSAYVTTVHRDSERESATAGCLLMFVEWGEIII